MSKIISLTSVVANNAERDSLTGDYYLEKQYIEIGKPIGENWFDNSNHYAPIHNDTDVVSIEETYEIDGHLSGYLVRTKDKHWFMFPADKYIAEFIEDEVEK